ncbi:hypothetical protein MXB_1935, partial [Myxobolus squamalis]
EKYHCSQKRRIRDTVQEIICNFKHRSIKNINAMRYIPNIMNIFYYQQMSLPKRSKKISHLILPKQFKISTNSIEHGKISCQYKIKLDAFTSIYTKLNKFVNFKNKSHEQDIYFAKFMTDDKIVVTNALGVVYLKQTKLLYKHTRPQNGEYIIGGGICSELNFRFTNIWKYDSLENLGDVNP